jgi:predicted lactoylglutathione lyase
VVIDDNIVLALHTHDTFAELVDGEVRDPSRRTMLVNALSTTSREEVDDLAARVDRGPGVGQGSATTTACTGAATPTRTVTRGK